MEGDEEEEPSISCRHHHRQAGVGAATVHENVSKLGSDGWMWLGLIRSGSQTTHFPLAAPPPTNR